MTPITPDGETSMEEHNGDEKVARRERKEFNSLLFQLTLKGFLSKSAVATPAQKIASWFSLIFDHFYCDSTEINCEHHATFRGR